MIKSLRPGRYRPGNQSGAILVNVMVVLFFTGSLGYAAAAMIKQSNQTNTSNLRYLQAQWAADYAINKAIDDIIKAGAETGPEACNQDIGPINLANNEASYRYEAKLSENELYCFVRAEGMLSRGGNDPAASVVKTVTLPLIIGDNDGTPAVGVKEVKEGMADDVKSGHTLIENSCGPGLGFGECSFCSDPEHEDYQKAQQVIEGDPKLKQLDFTTSTMFKDPDNPETELTPEEIIHAMRDAVLEQADSISDSCKFTPESNPETAVCVTTGGGANNRKIECTSGSTTKIIDPNTCDSIALHSGRIDITHSLSLRSNDGESLPLLHAHAINDLNITNSTSGIYSSEGYLDIALNGNKVLDGLFIGTRTDALELSGTDVIRGLFSILTESDLEFQLNGGGSEPAVIEGAVFTNAAMRFNRNGHARISYNHEYINKWRDYMPFLKEAFCSDPNTISASAVSDMMYKLF